MRGKVRINYLVESPTEYAQLEAKLLPALAHLKINNDSIIDAKKTNETNVALSIWYDSQNFWPGSDPVLPEPKVVVLDDAGKLQVTYDLSARGCLEPTLCLDNSTISLHYHRYTEKLPAQEVREKRVITSSIPPADSPLTHYNIFGEGKEKEFLEEKLSMFINHARFSDHIDISRQGHRVHVHAWYALSDDGNIPMTISGKGENGMMAQIQTRYVPELNALKGGLIIQINGTEYEIDRQFYSGTLPDKEKRKRAISFFPMQISGDPW